MSVLSSIDLRTERDGWYHSRREHEQRLFARFAADRSPAARDAIVEQFMPLARQLARRYRNVEEIEDLEQIAAMGLVKAVDRFDPERGLAFSSYAFPTILGELKRHLRDRGWSVRPPREVQELVARIDHHSRDLLAVLGRSPTADELAERVGSTVEQVLEAMQAATARRATSLDHAHRDGDDHDGHTIEIATEEPGFAAAEAAVLLDDLLRQLGQRQRVVLKLRFHDDLTQSEIGAIVGVSQMHVSRLIRGALEQLRTADGRLALARPGR